MGRALGTGELTGLVDQAASTLPEASQASSISIKSVISQSRLVTRAAIADVTRSDGCRLGRSVVRVASTPEPSLGAVAGDPFPGFGLGFKALDVLRVAARPSGHYVPFVPRPHRLRIDRDPVVRFGHAQQYAPGPSRKPPSRALPKCSRLIRKPSSRVKGRGRVIKGLEHRNSSWLPERIRWER
jgi:hypothetical protein